MIPAAGQSGSWKALSAAVYRAFPWKRVGAALLLTLFAHLAVYEAAPETLEALARTVVPAEPVELVRAEDLEKIPEELLPEEFRRRPQFVPANPNAPSATPKDTSNFAAADQRAAQEEAAPDARGRTPKLDGELEDSLAVSDDALPRELLPPELRSPAPAAEPQTAPSAKTPQGENAAKTQGIDAPSVSAGTLARGDDAPETGDEDDRSEDDVPDPAPRPSVVLPPAGLKSITMRSNTSVNEVGVCSLDAKYSEFGDYTQRMLEAIQAAWYLAVWRSSIVQTRAVVVVEFTLNADGTLEDARVVSSNASAPATYACLDAVASRAPFEPWRADMIALVGKNSETSRISFHYR